MDSEAQADLPPPQAETAEQGAQAEEAVEAGAGAEAPAEAPPSDAPAADDAGAPLPSEAAVYQSYEAGDVDSAGYRDFSAPHELSEGGASGESQQRKPYLGGLRDTRNNKTYHHAYTETGDARIRPNKWAHIAPGSRIERETQTSTGVTRSVQSYRESGAQTARRDLHHDAAGDREVVPRRYITSEEVLQVRTAQAIRIQCAIRSALARRMCARLMAERDAYKASLIQRAHESAAEAAARAERDAYRRANPRTPEDFAVLYDEIEAWRLAETARIDIETAAAREKVSAMPLPPLHALNGPEVRKQQADAMAEITRQRYRALARLTRREQELVARVERLRAVGMRDNAESRIQREMEGMAAPQAWGTSMGETVTVVTPFAARAAQLKALFDALSAPVPLKGNDPDADRVALREWTNARMDTLLHVKYTVREFDTALVREICGLIEREVDMMGRGRPTDTLTNLRGRIRSLFLSFCQTPEFNPNAAAFTRAPGGPLGALQGTANLTGKKSAALTAPWATGVNLSGTGGSTGGGAGAAASMGSTTGSASGNKVPHPYAGTSRDPRLLTIPSFMRPTLRKPAGQ